ncbi:hypothetical protein EGI32_00895, partial [Ferruginibacter sp. HRS2-29]|nr:hypothetical protein [Ferruginibacter sp. HRS2-29]
MLPIFFLSYSTLFKLKKKATNTRIKFALNKTISFVYSWQKNTRFLSGYSIYFSKIRLQISLSSSTLFTLKRKATNTQIKFALNKTISFVYSWQKNTRFLSGYSIYFSKIRLQISLSSSTLFTLKRKATNTQIKFALNK